MNDDIFSLENAAMERWRNGDPMGYVETSADDIIYVDPSLASPIIGLGAYHLHMQMAVGKIFYQRSEFIGTKVEMYASAALLTYNYRSTVLSPDGSVNSQTPWNVTEVYFYRQGTWKIAHAHFSYTRHKAPVRVELPLPVSSSPVEYGGVLAELMTLEQAAMHRWRNGDPVGYLDLYAPAVTYFDPGSPLRVDGREAMRSIYKTLEGQISYEVMDFVDPRVLLSGDLAVLFYRFLSTSLNPDGSIKSRTPWNCTEVYLRSGARCSIIHNHWSLINGERE